MSMTATPATSDRDTENRDSRFAPVGLEDAEARRAARDAWRADQDLTGVQLGRMFPYPDGTPRSADWGRKQIRAVRAVGVGRVVPITPTVTQDEPPRPAAVPPAVTPRRGAARTPARRSTPPVALLALHVLACAVVGLVTAVVSYTHIRDLAVTHGMGDLAGWLPLGVDGLVVACSVTLIVDRRYGGPGARGSVLAWAGVMIGLVGSVTANVLAAPPDPVSRVLAAYPPVALAVSCHLLFRMLGDR